ncbi:hypothetical protein ACIBG6_16530 [Streptomyces sp. NPDC050842]|uniref:hypothetical protein n=1 Tax=Streptomyces sp. NPDC050842 TaxID=3365636 RepID=UPI0037948823
MNYVDYGLHQKVREVGQLVGRLGEQLGSVSGQVAGVDARQQQTTRELGELLAEFRAFAGRTERVANVQRAETRIGRVQDEIDHEFGHYKEVRRTAVGMLQAFDTGLVAEETIRTVGEQLMLRTPRYWLAPALVALASWASDDRVLCERAVEEAFRRSPARTSLFFALVLRRQERLQSSHRWLRHYLLAQDPVRLGREFAVILESIAQGAFGLAGREMLAMSLREWRDRLAHDTAARDRQVRRWRHEIDSLAAPSAAADYPLLAALSPEWPALDRALSLARAQQRLLDKYQAVLDREPGPSERLEDAVDDILDRLVGAYDDEELPLRWDLALSKNVVRHAGDMDRARKATESEAALYEETLDYLTVQSAAALTPAAIGTSAATQRLAIAACDEWFAEAHAGYTRDCRAAVPQDVQIRLDETHTVESRIFRLPPWRGSLNEPMATLETRLAEHWSNHTDSFLNGLAYPLAARVAPLVVVLLAILALVGQAGVVAALLLALCTGAVWGFVIHRAARDAAATHSRVREALDRAKRASLHRLRGASAERTDWEARFKEADAVESRCRDVISAYGLLHQEGSPFEGRTVRKEDDR